MSVAAGYHAVEYNEGDKYQGEWNAEGQREGFGILTFADGARFVGHFKAGLCHGKGILTFPDNSKYEGDFEGGKYHGYGVYQRADGMKFQGQFQAGQVDGSGLLTFPDGTHGQPRQEGIWKGSQLLTRTKASEAVNLAERGRRALTSDQIKAPAPRTASLFTFPPLSLDADNNNTNNSKQKQNHCQTPQHQTTSVMATSKNVTFEVSRDDDRQSITLPLRIRTTASSSFKGNTMLENAEAELQRVSGDQSRCIDRYMRQTGMDVLCPRVAAWCFDEPIPGDRGLLDDYLPHMSHTNSIVTLCDILAGDVENGHLKHLAHQVALLYQAVVHCGRPLEAYRAAIETRFTKLKSATRVDENGDPIGLPPALRMWLLFVLERLKEDALQSPPLGRDEMAAIVQWLTDEDE
ncbi:MORN repeat-containing protein 4 [Salpingoeca rosetta]|uniref:MORN repeat-containing protein 4 n=1 Tax=Salpingoeca rosetta (strain ATCC 50818 / BSB-021) TaxID=946362 RepID=F2UH54_SALR5|nr:MORN repeat-containing protein 4 [Salpingoeca rosetta]EGD76453.1 MORN repeat-containing protein 4 [Salpingoeca rosetta]|eukprot:XP_004991368.1 MORN repeat-containing protein 4 [Salpingoeca rosetta]